MFLQWCPYAVLINIVVAVSSNMRPLVDHQALTTFQIRETSHNSQGWSASMHNCLRKRKIRKASTKIPPNSKLPLAQELCWLFLLSLHQTNQHPLLKLLQKYKEILGKNKNMNKLSGKPMTRLYFFSNPCIPLHSSFPTCDQILHHFPPACFIRFILSLFSSKCIT